MNYVIKQELSEINHERATHMPYPYTKGRLPYARLEQNIVCVNNYLDILLFFININVFSNL